MGCSNDIFELASASLSPPSPLSPCEISNCCFRVSILLLSILPPRDLSSVAAVDQEEEERKSSLFRIFGKCPLQYFWGGGGDAEVSTDIQN